MERTRRTVLATLVGSPAVGVVAWIATGQWRWSVTGVLAGAALLSIIASVAGFLDTDVDAGGPGCMLVLLVLFGLGPLAGITLWLWTGNPYWGLGALLSPFVGMLALGVLATIGDA